MTDSTKRIALIGVPAGSGAGTPGAAMGPAAYRVAGLAEALGTLGHGVEDRGDLAPDGPTDGPAPAGARNAAEVAAWTRAVRTAALRALADGAVPLTLGGDHSVAAGTLSAAAAHAEAAGRPLFVLWLDAHPDFNTPETSPSGNLHGVPMAYACGLPGFDRVLDAAPARVDPARVCMIGIRSVDPEERRLIEAHGVRVEDMRRIDENGIARLLAPFLAEVGAAGGHLHVSFDADVLDPEIAPGTGTPVPGGLNAREAHLVMEMLADSGAVTSLDLVELNPFLDHAGRTARLMTDLAASLFGRRVMTRRPARAA